MGGRELVNASCNFGEIGREETPSLNGIVQAGWAGSAAIGGRLADEFGYGVVFFGTSALHTAGVLVQCGLLLLEFLQLLSLWMLLAYTHSVV